MECEHPVKIRDPDHYTSDWDKDKYYIQVGCGRCAACQSNHRKMWYFRLKVEDEHSLSSFCVTLTYNDLDCPGYVPYKDEFLYHPIRYEDVQLFNKKLRKRLGPMRFFAVCEFGPDKLRPHYHIVYWYDHIVSDYDFHDAVFRSWFPDTRITIDRTNDKAAQYILSYCLSTVDYQIPKEFWPKIHCSTKPFIGSGLLDDSKFLSWLHLKKSDLTNHIGYRSRLPRILRDRIFDDDEKLFIKEEMKRALNERALRKSESLDELERKYGFWKAVEYIQMDRNSFNNSVKRKSKIKSIR